MEIGVPAKTMSDKLYKRLILAMGASLFALVVWRAFIVSFTHDECITYFMFIKQDWSEFFDGKTLQTNNHLINTALAKLIYVVFGNQEWALRLPNVLFFILYLRFAYRILDTFCQNKIIVLVSYLFVCFVPYVLDFFSLCRGYGISMACLMAAVYYFLVFINKTQAWERSGQKHLWITLGYLALSTLGNLTVFYFTLAFFLYSIINYLVPFLHREFKRADLFYIIRQLWPWTILLFLTFRYADYIKSTGSLGAFDMHEKFWEARMAPLINNVFHGSTKFCEGLMFAFVVFGALVLMVSLGIVLYATFKNRETFTAGRFVMASLLFCAIVAIVLHNNYEIPYPPQRAIAFMVPFFFMLVAFLADHLSSRSKISAGLITSCAGIFSITGIIVSFEPAIISDWPQTSRVKEMVRLMNREGKEKFISASFLYYPTLRYYTEKLGCNNLKTVVIQGPDTLDLNFNYMLFENEKPLSAGLKKLQISGWENTRGYFLENSAFNTLDCREEVSKKEFWRDAKKEEVFMPPIPFSASDLKPALKLFKGHEYSEVSSFVIDSITARASVIRVNYKTNFISGKDNPSATLVVERNRNDQGYSWEGPTLNSYEIKKNEWKEVEINTLFRGDYQAGDVIRAFFYYIDTDTIWIHNARLSVRAYN